MNKSNCLIFVWIGSELPFWSTISINLAVKNTKCKVYLLTTKYNTNISKECTQVELETFYNFKESNFQSKNDKFRDGFWIKTTERFFILRDFVKYNNITSFFHAELDNLIFDLSNLNLKLDKIGSGIFTPKDNLNRCIASLIYVNNSVIINELCDYIISNPEKLSNDMLLLGAFSKYNKNVYFLPNESVLNEYNEIDYINQKEIGGIFDAASIGQYLFGIDPRNSRFPIFNKFINENAKYDLTKCNFEVSIEKNKAILNGYNLYNIHVHSKIFKKLIISSWLDRIIKRINQKKKSLITINI